MLRLPAFAKDPNTMTLPLFAARLANVLRVLCVASLCLSGAHAADAPKARRIALVIGNSDYQHTDGSLGYFQHRFAVYGREGEPCLSPACAGVIVRRVQANRSTFYCPACQRG